VKERKRIVTSLLTLGVLLKSHPVLLPASTFVIARAFQVAPPVALLSRMVRYVTVSVPLASEIVACVPGVVLPKNLAVVPVVTNEPTPLVAPDFRFKVPLVKVSALVEPSVKASRQLVVPVPLKVTGKSIVCVLLVIVAVPTPLN
jgi:hypothetical protein